MEKINWEEEFEKAENNRFLPSPKITFFDKHSSYEFRYKKK